MGSNLSFSRVIINETHNRGLKSVPQGRNKHHYFFKASSLSWLACWKACDWLRGVARRASILLCRVSIPSL